VLREKAEGSSVMKISRHSLNEIADDGMKLMMRRVHLRSKHTHKTGNRSESVMECVEEINEIKQLSEQSYGKQKLQFKCANECYFNFRGNYN
jgi:hypothetical protein